MKNAKIPKIPAKFTELLRLLGQRGGRRSMVTMTREQRVARATVASMAAAKVRSEKAASRRLVPEITTSPEVTR